MSLRCKFYGGKLVSMCQRGSWHARSCGADLRKNMGTSWSPTVWEQGYPEQFSQRNILSKLIYFSVKLADTLNRSLNGNFSVTSVS